MEPQFNIKGAKELDALLKLLPEQVARKLAENAVRAGANYLKKKLEERAPGTIAKAILVRKDKNGPASVNYKIGTSKDAPHAHLVEFGTTAHKVAVGKKRGHQTGKKVLSDGSTIYGTVIDHPGAQAKPFFRPVLDEEQKEYLIRLQKNMARGLAREAERFTGKRKR